MGATTTATVRLNVFGQDAVLIHFAASTCTRSRAKRNETWAGRMPFLVL